MHSSHDYPVGSSDRTNLDGFKQLVYQGILLVVDDLGCLFDWQWPDLILGVFETCLSLLSRFQDLMRRS